MKKLLTLLLLSPLAFAETLPLCKDTLLYWVNYFDECRTEKYVNDGERYSGGWKNNKYHGRLTVHKDLKSNTTTMGEFVNGKKHGPHTSMLEDESLVMIQYSYGEVINVNVFPASNSKANSTYAQPLPSISSSSSDGSFLAEIGASLLGGNKSTPSSSTRSKVNTPSYSTYSAVRTVPSNQLCPQLASRLVKQEVVRGNRICYYQ